MLLILESTEIPLEATHKVIAISGIEHEHDFKTRQRRRTKWQTRQKTETKTGKSEEDRN